MTSLQFIEYYVATNPNEVGIILLLEKEKDILRNMYFMYFAGMNMCCTEDGLMSFNSLINKYTSGKNTINKYKLTQINIKDINTQHQLNNIKYDNTINKIMVDAEQMSALDQIHESKKGEYVIIKYKEKFIITKFGEIVENTEFIFTHGYCSYFAEKLAEKNKLSTKALELKITNNHIIKKVELLVIKRPITIYEHAFCTKDNKAYDITGVFDIDDFLQKQFEHSLKIFDQLVNDHLNINNYCYRIVDYYDDQFQSTVLNKTIDAYVDSIIDAYNQIYFCNNN
jgi:hypothetical protein